MTVCFSKLKVWVIDGATEKLLNLKDADVCAIYLGRAQTDFELKTDEKTQGVLR